jgi:hypothetical protein
MSYEKESLHSAMIFVQSVHYTLVTISFISHWGSLTVTRLLLVKGHGTGGAHVGLTVSCWPW